MHRVFGELIPDCSKCEGEPTLRAQYGCDAPADRPVLTVSRPGGGGQALYRCPGRLTEQRPDIRAAFWYCRQYEEQALLPWHGGLDEQAAGFLEMLHAYSVERRHVEELPEKKKEATAKRLQDLRMKAAMARQEQQPRG